MRQQSISVVSLVEPVGRWNDYQQSRIKRYRFECLQGDKWVTMVQGETPVPAAIQRIPRVTTQRIRLSFESSSDTPHIAEIGAYDEP